MSDTGDKQPDAGVHRHGIWWAYFALALVMFGLSLVQFVVSDSFATLRMTLLSAALLSHDAICIAGLYAFIRSLPLFAPAVWRIMLTLMIARALVAISFLAPSLSPWDYNSEHLVALAALAGLLLWAPMVVALWRYAFKSPQIWGRAAA